MSVSGQHTHCIRRQLAGAQALALPDELQRVPWETISCLELSFLQVRRVDASGVVALVRLYSQLARQGIRLVLIDVREAVRRELNRLNLTRLMPIIEADAQPSTLELVMASYDAGPGASYEAAILGSYEGPLL